MNLIATNNEQDATKGRSPSVRNTLLLALAIILLLTLAACSSQGPKTINPPPAPISQKAPPTATTPAIPNPSAQATRSDKQTYSKLMSHYEEWRGVRYRLGGKSKKGIDCSAFVQVTYRNVFDVKLPRTTDKQRYAGKVIEKKQLDIGDLVFFKINRRLDHVGVYLGKGRFMHASTSSGVMISELKQDYWAKRYWKAVRV